MLIVAAVGVFIWLKQPSPQAGANVTYTDPEGVFSFEYPSNWNVSGREGPIMARVKAPNKEELVLRWSNQENDIRNCPEERMFDGDCWAFDYPTDSSYSEDFEDIVQSFKYLVNSD